MAIVWPNFINFKPGPGGITENCSLIRLYQTWTISSIPTDSRISALRVLMFPNWDLTREGLGQASSLGYSPSPANGWEWATLSSGPARSYGRRLWPGQWREGKGLELAIKAESWQAAAAVKGRAWGSEAAAAWLAWLGRDSLVGDEWSTARSRPWTRDNLFNENYHWPMWGLHLHPHNDTRPTDALHHPIITPFTHIGNMATHSFNQPLATNLHAVHSQVLSGRFCQAREMKH